MVAPAFHGRKYAIHKRYNNSVLASKVDALGPDDGTILFVDEYCIYVDTPIKNKKTTRILQFY